jgi:chemotaxis protein MotA
VDLATLFGLIIGLGGIAAAISLGTSPSSFFDVPSLLIVVGGVLASTLIKFPLSVVLATAQVVRQTFVPRMASPELLVGIIVRLARDVRRESLLAMEHVPVHDPFLRRGIALAVDGADPALIESVLRSEVAAEVERHERGQRLLRSMGQSSPAFGMIGTLIGLVQMMATMDDPSKIGSAMAVALLTTFYGAALAYLLFLPLADKLHDRTRAEILQREIVIQGMHSIMSGHHPKMIERRLHALLGPGASTSGRLPRNRLRSAA